MEIQERTSGTVTVLELSGKLMVGDGDGLLKDKVHSLLFQDRRNILLDLGRVASIDSTGLGEIVATYTTVMNRGGRIKLVHLTRRIHDLLAITKLLTVFETFESEDEALASFQAAET